MKPKLIALLLLVALSLLAADRQFLRTIDETVPLSSNGSVYLDTRKGAVVVSAWDRPEVEIHARIEPDISPFGHQRECVANTEVKIDPWPNSLRIHSDYHRLEERGVGFWEGLLGDCGTRPLVNYEIRMPRTARLIVRDVNSTIRVTGIQGGAKIHTRRGRVHLRDCLK
jgi:hypothetical protein